MMWAVGQCLPDFSAFSTVSYAADGYNVPWDRVAADVSDPAAGDLSRGRCGGDRVLPATDCEVAK